MKLSRWGLFSTVVLAVVIATIIGRYPDTVLTGGHANASNPGSQTALLSAARDTSVEEPFDYFPDHFTNQGKEPAEPIDTF